MADAKGKWYLGTTTTTAINTTTDIANGDFSGAPAATFDNTNDATLPYASHAKVVAQFPDWAAAPTANSYVELWGVLKDVDGTSDDTDAPSGANANGARYFDAFRLDDVDALQRRTLIIDVFGMEKIDFYIKNGSGQNMNNDAGTSCVVKVTPLAFGANY